MDSFIGQKIDNYKILDVIGRGGMGVVYKAIDMNLEKTVALKMIDPFYAGNESFLKRFRTEAIALAKLENKNIVSVYALRETDNGLFMVMEYVDAKTVSEWLREKGVLSVDETLKIVRQLLNAINHAHKVGVIHRDIKPNNILLCEDGTVKVMDFGLAKLIQEHGEQSTVTQTAGTLYYMSPEQIKGLKVDNRTDIYSIGMTIYEMLTGRTPFEKGAGEYNIQKQIIEGKIESPEKYHPGIPKSLVKFIMKAIDKNPEKRFQNINEMLSELYRFETVEKPGDDKTKIVSDSGVFTGDNEKKKKTVLYASMIVILVILFSAYMFLMKPFNGKKENTISNNKVPANTLLNDNNNIKFARLSIDSSPGGAIVLIDNKKVGKTPFLKDSLKIKNYSIALKKSGYKDWLEPDYHITFGDNNILANLIPEAAAPVKTNSVLILNAVPSADIFVDKNKIASGTSEIVRSNVSSGQHIIKFVNAQFGTKELNLDINNQESKSITCYFRQQINIQSLNVKGDAFWGNIYINGKNTGKTTPGDTLLGPGSYTITVKKTGYKTDEGDVVLNITPTFELKTHSLVFHLK
ncbi:MAG: serine/threonine-protein kinase [Ignavibacteriaceae bacterium]